MASTSGDYPPADAGQLVDPLDEEHDRLARQVAAVERFMRTFLAASALATVVLGVIFMVAIGGGRSHLPGRLIVAVAAVFILGAIDTSATRLANRRRPLLAPDPPAYRRFVVSSVIAFFVAASVLFGVALFLP